MNCFVKSSFILASEAERVTIIPVETDMRSAGICDIRPSPTVATLSEAVAHFLPAGQQLVKDLGIGFGCAVEQDDSAWMNAA